MTESLNTKDALDHAWSWFAVHAGQRMQVVNFFLVATALLTSAYSIAANGGHFKLAAGIAGGGALLSVYFQRLDIRTRELVKAGERALLPLQKQLAAVSDVTFLEILKSVETPGRRFTSYGDVIRAIHYTSCLGFLLAADVAVLKDADDFGRIVVLFVTWPCRSRWSGAGRLGPDRTATRPRKTILPKRARDRVIGGPPIHHPAIVWVGASAARQP